MSLKAVVIGAGFSGEGQISGLRHCNINNITLCGRSIEPAKQVAQKLHISDLRFDWKQALEDIRPDILCIATTVPSHLDMITTGAKLGCNIVCDKPLAANAKEAKIMYETVVNAGIKHGYCPTGPYYPAVSYVKSLIEKGKIGRLRNLELTMYKTPRIDAAYSWMHNLADGGGELNTVFTHILQAFLRLSSAKVEGVSGFAKSIISKMPMGGRFHDSRKALLSTVDLNQPDLKWVDSDADDTFYTTLDLKLPDNTHAFASINVLLGRTPSPSGMHIHGTKGSIVFRPFSDDIMVCYEPTDREANSYEEKLRPTNEWTKLTVPKEFFANDGTGDRAIKAYNRFFARFIPDVLNKPHGDYATFHDGYIACCVIDAIRSKDFFTPIK